MRLLTLASTAGLVALGGCGSVSKAPEEPAAKPVQLRVQQARFLSVRQVAGDQVTLTMTVTNTGRNAVRDLIVTLSGNQPDQVAMRGDQNPNDVPQGTDDLPNSVRRAAWFIDDGPQHAPLGGGNSWNAGPLPAGRTTTLRWSMAAITPGRHTLGYDVAGGLTDKAARATSGTGIHGSVAVTIVPSGSDAPQ